MFEAEVKLCAFKCLPSFLEEVSVEGREGMIEFLGDLFRSNDNWRVREARCELIGAMAKYFMPDKLFSKMVHVLWEKTLEDEVRASDVAHDACRTTPSASLRPKTTLSSL